MIRARAALARIVNVTTSGNGERPIAVIQATHGNPTDCGNCEGREAQEVSRAARRQAAGGVPNSRLNARLNAASDS